MYHHRDAVKGYNAHPWVYLPQNPAISTQFQHHSAHNMYHCQDSFENVYPQVHLPQNPAISTQFQHHPAHQMYQYSLENVYPWLYLSENPAISTQFQFPHSHVVMDTPPDTTILAQPALSASSTSLLGSSQNGYAHFKQGKPHGVPYKKIQAQPRVKQPVRRLVNAVKGDFIICRWRGCYKMVEATMHAIHVHTVEHSKREKTCQWSPAENREICNFSGAINGRHTGGHLHYEGQPSPWVVECKCGYRYVATGSGNGHQPGCPFKKTSMTQKQRREGQKTVTRGKWDFSCVQIQL